LEDALSRIPPSLPAPLFDSASPPQLRAPSNDGIPKMAPDSDLLIERLQRAFPTIELIERPFRRSFL
jgi:hypothetical protein